MGQPAEKHPENDPFLAALDRAPVGEPWTPEQRAELDEIMQGIREGRVELIPHEEREAWFEAHRHEIGDRSQE